MTLMRVYLPWKIKLLQMFSNQNHPLRSKRMNLCRLSRQKLPCVWLLFINFIALMTYILAFFRTCVRLLSLGYKIRIFLKTIFIKTCLICRTLFTIWDLFKSDPFQPPVVVETKIHISICNLCFPQPNKVVVQTFRDGYSCAHRWKSREYLTFSNLLIITLISCRSAVRPLIFTRSGRFVNPSRIHPGELGIGVIFPEERYELTVDGDTAICVSCAMSKDSFLRTIDTQGQANLSNKYSLLRAKLMAYEWERASSLFTLLLGKGQLYALMKGDANEFQTKSADPKRGTDGMS